MCGILGITPPGEREHFAEALARLRHRGPDGGGIFCDDAIMLGHRRLSILDISDTGRQPMAYAGGRYQIVYNGEVYNFPDLRADLEARGHVFCSSSDTEVVLAAYAEWGPDCLRRFNGMWSLAIWDTRERTLFLSRDRLGKKPLFYAWIGRQFVFASEMKAIMAFMENARPNRDVVLRAVQNAFCYEATDQCLIEGIRRFPAGHYGVLRDGGALSLTRYWNTLDHLVQVPERYEEQVEVFRELFLDACRIRMRSDVPIGTALSGGLDSSSTISSMAHVGRTVRGERVSNDWQHAFVASFKGSFLDESEHARKVVDNLGIQATFIEIDPAQGVGRMNDYFYHFEELYFTSPIPFMLTYGAVRDHGIKVTIDGHGADELFAGYPGAIIAAIDDAGWNRRRVREVTDTIKGMFPENQGQSVAPNLGLTHRLRRFYQSTKGIPRRFLSGRKTDIRLKRMGALNRTLYTQTHETILPTLLRNYDRYSMANSVEIRMPFLDHRILSFAFSLPWHAKVRDGYSKKIVRDAMAPFLPADIAYRRDKIGFNSPTVEWMRGPLRSFVLDTIHDPAFKASALVDAKRAAALVSRVLESPAATFDDGSRAWASLEPFLWERAMFSKRPGAASAGDGATG
ncbi:MAG: asparagine synthase (glutamine-hydrolyzing) [Nitrospirae bacterium]|nr:asparagine synthase (glutamine-hydrolyzing) [Nitrospirota bacterium]